MATLPDGYTIHSATGLDTISTRVFHDIARLRQEVFVVEQECPYLDVDGRDAEPGTIQYWVAAPDESIAATLRVLEGTGESDDEPGLKAIGRVATSMRHRGKSLASALMETAVVDHGHGPLWLAAQSYLTEWYAGFGFAACGAEFIEDGIPHTPMRRG